MRRTQVLLFAEGGGEKQRISAQAEECAEGDALVFCFSAEGAEFVFRFGKTAVIRRKGGIAYSIELDPNRTTYTEIVTEYGFLSAEVRTLRSEILRKNGFYFKGEYELYYDGYAQRHEVSFFALSERRAKS